MPELPEVEIARENLERWLLGRRIRSARAPDERIRGPISRRSFERSLEGATVKGVARRGKFLLIDLGKRRPAILAHLGMTGKFLRIGSADEPPRFARVELQLPRGERVVLQDARRLGQFRWLDERERKRLSALGIEPLTSEWNPRALERLTRRSGQPIKLFLLDQKKIAGIGNIHAAEALFLAGIHPGRRARSLSTAELARLVRALRRELRLELARFRSAGLDYLHEGGKNAFRVYGRAGEPCRRCGTRIGRFVQAGRSSYYCPCCQPETWTDET
jgi:formamidopyrimidine-DNA glycosylase